MRGRPCRIRYWDHPDYQQVSPGVWWWKPVNKPRDNSGALFKNTRKKTETQPDYQGEALIAGHDYYISAWLRKSAQGVTYMSLAFKGKAPKPDYHPPHSAYQGKQQTLPVDREPGSDDDKGEDDPPA